MERFALLIDASNVKGLKDLPGARNDIDNWKDFLTSKLGGSWIYSSDEEKSEIIIRKKPMSGDVKNLLVANKSKYCFVAFAGHGFHDKKRDKDYVCLNDHNHDCPLSIITPDSNQGTLVVDACRGFEDAHVVASIEKSASHSRQNLIVANEATELRALSAGSRTAFSNVYYADTDWAMHLRGCGTGIVKMLSCAKGEAADDIRVNGVEKGGIYTTILMRSAMRWEKANLYSHLYKTDQAHTDTVKYMAANFPQQHPEYSPLTVAYPFAVK